MQQVCCQTRGDPEPRLSAPGTDLRTDRPGYAVYRNGQRAADQREIRDLWTPSSVAFLIGSGMSVDRALEEAGVPTDRYRWVLRTKVPTIPAGRFRGPLAVTMRWLRPVQALIAAWITARYPQFHGAPIHVGNPDALGADLERPLFGPAVPPIPPDLVPAFWACGVTPQEAALASGLLLVMAHAPGHGFITDLVRTTGKPGLWIYGTNFVHQGGEEGIITIDLMRLRLSMLLLFCDNQHPKILSG